MASQPPRRRFGIGKLAFLGVPVVLVTWWLQKELRKSNQIETMVFESEVQRELERRRAQNNKTLTGSGGADKTGRPSASNSNS